MMCPTARKSSLSENYYTDAGVSTGVEVIGDVGSFVIPFGSSRVTSSDGIFSEIVGVLGRGVCVGESLGTGEDVGMGNSLINTSTVSGNSPSTLIPSGTIKRGSMT